MLTNISSWPSSRAGRILGELQQLDFNRRQQTFAGAFSEYIPFHCPLSSWISRSILNLNSFPRNWSDSTINSSLDRPLHVHSLGLGWRENHHPPICEFSEPRISLTFESRFLSISLLSDFRSSTALLLRLLGVGFGRWSSTKGLCKFEMKMKTMERNNQLSSQQKIKDTSGYNWGKECRIFFKPDVGLSYLVNSPAGESLLCLSQYFFRWSPVFVLRESGLSRKNSNFCRGVNWFWAL